MVKLLIAFHTNNTQAALTPKDVYYKLLVGELEKPETERQSNILMKI